MMGRTRYIPAFLEPYKNQWLTTTKLNYLFCLKKADEESIMAATFIYKNQIPSVKQYTSRGPHKFVNTYLVKRVLAIAMAHGYNAIAPLDGETPECPSCFKLMNKLQLAQAQLKIPCPDCAELRRELRKKSDEANEDKQILQHQISLFETNKSLIFKMMEATAISEKPGVYFLFQGEELVYIGQGKNVAQRVADRNNLVTKSMMITEHDDNKRNELERSLIRLWTPRGNKRHNEKYYARMRKND